MMELIENIAAKQTALARADWPAWCARLEQTLARIAGSPVVDYFRALGLNPLSPLRGAAFRPDLAEADATREGEMYAAALARVPERHALVGTRASPLGRADLAQAGTHRRARRDRAGTRSCDHTNRRPCPAAGRARRSRPAASPPAQVLPRQDLRTVRCRVRECRSGW